MCFKKMKEFFTEEAFQTEDIIINKRLKQNSHAQTPALGFH